MPAPSSTQLDWFDPRILSPAFADRAVHAISADDLDFLRSQLKRHLFETIDIDGEHVVDRAGWNRALSAAMRLKASELRPTDDPTEKLPRLLSARAARRIALILTGAERSIEADLEFFLGLIDAIASTAAVLRDSSPRTQLVAFLAGADPAFRPIDPAVRQRAAACPAIKVMPGEARAADWSRPAAFDLDARHHFLIGHGEWYYLSRGYIARGDDRPWHCVEADDRLTFIRRVDNAPGVEGVFARLPAGMQLVALRYESDESRHIVSSYSDDPFTMFRGLCEQLSRWQAHPT